MHPRIPLATFPLAAAFVCHPVWGQAATPAIFVANNGNAEGSVTSLRVEDGGGLRMVQKLVLGAVSEGGEPHPGTNAITIALSPNGRWLAVGHATTNELVERVSLVEVLPDVTMRLAGAFETPDAPLCVRWVDDGVLAVTRSSVSSGSAVLTYAVDVDAGHVSLVSLLQTGLFTTSMAWRPQSATLYTQDTLSSTLFVLAVDENGMLSYRQVVGAVGYPLGIGLSPSGGLLAFGGGIGAGGKAVPVYAIDALDGLLTALPQSPFTSPGSSPKQVVFTDDGAFALVAHGGDSTIRSFAVDPSSGALAPTGFFVKVGVQGSLGEIATQGTLLFATDRDTLVDGVRGVLSYAIQGDGSLTPIGSIVDTLGSTPNAIATWQPTRQPPKIVGDLNGDGLVNGADLGLLLAAWEQRGSPADLDASGVVDGGDLGLLLAAWNELD